jgi:hypothetical protein
MLSTIRCFRFTTNAPSQSAVAAVAPSTLMLMKSTCCDVLVALLVLVPRGVQQIAKLHPPAVLPVSSVHHVCIVATCAILLATVGHLHACVTWRSRIVELLRISKTADAEDPVSLVFCSLILKPWGESRSIESPCD